MKPLKIRCVFKKKDIRNGEMLFRARILAKDFANINDKDFNEIYSTVTILDTARTVIIQAASSKAVFT